MSDMITSPLRETGPWQGAVHLPALANASVGEASRGKNKSVWQMVGLDSEPWSAA